MLVSAAPYSPSNGQFNLSAMSVAVFGWMSEVGLSTGPYQATAAFTRLLFSAISHTARPPRQKPVVATWPTSPLFLPAQVMVESTSERYWASGAFEITSLMIVGMSVIFDRSPIRA